MTIRVIALAVFVFSYIGSFAQQQFKVVAIGFYNVENFFDTKNDSNKLDEDFTPDGVYHYTDEVYSKKLHNIAKVFASMGTEVTPDGPAIIGMAEVENDNVLKDLIKQPEIAQRNYKYEWFYTSDERGISTAMLYNPKYFTVLSSQPVRVPTEEIGWTRPTRDVLYVCGILASDTVHVLVNHWPSKGGGAKATDPGRKLAATVNRHILDSLIKAIPNAKVLIMGDLNDDPTCSAIVKELNAKAKKNEVTANSVYNPWIDMYKNGLGSSSYRGEWHIIDQIMLSQNFLKNSNDKWSYYNAEIFKRDFNTNKIGDDKGFPHRSFSINKVWDDGYSDHYPVLVYLVSKVKH